MFCKFSVAIIRLGYIVLNFLPFILQSNSPYSDPVDGLHHRDSAGICRIQPPQVHVVNLKEYCLPLHHSLVCSVWKEN